MLAVSFSKEDFQDGGLEKRTEISALAKQVYWWFLINSLSIIVPPDTLAPDARNTAKPYSKRSYFAFT